MAHSRSRRGAAYIPVGLHCGSTMDHSNEARCQDTDRVRQWMAKNTTDQSMTVENRAADTFGINCMIDEPQVSAPVQMAEYCIAPDTCAHHSNPFALTCDHTGLGIKYGEPNMIEPEFTVPNMGKCMEPPLDCSFDYSTGPGGNIPMDYEAYVAKCSLPSPEYDEMQPWDTTNPQFMFDEGNASHFPPGWNPSGNSESLTYATSPDSQPMDWSNSGFANSVVSSNSHDSFMQLPDTPLSITIGEESWSGPQLVPHGIYDGFSHSAPAGSLQHPTVPFVDDQRFDVGRQTGLSVSDFTSSTMRPNRTFQRPPISDLNLWSSPQCGLAYATPPYTINKSRRPSEEGTSSARKDARYQVQRQQDNMFHCPFEVAGCTHKPENLKCNYDKHLDSHLKPYRCKRPECPKHQFSSTACLLRHEREAHGLHGHGDKPYTCLFKDCDRYYDGNGFPRRWNLYDHMKRCHQYEPEGTSSNDSPSPPSTSSHVSMDMKPPFQGKRSPDVPKTVASRKPKANNSSRTSNRPSKAQPTPLEQRRTSLRQEFEFFKNESHKPQAGPKGAAAWERNERAAARLGLPSRDIKREENRR